MFPLNFILLIKYQDQVEGVVLLQGHLHNDLNVFNLNLSKPSANPSSSCSVSSYVPEKSINFVSTDSISSSSTSLNFWH